MKPETFFEKFELFADAPDAVVKMRELVFALAMRGKLVVQEPTEEPAALLLRKIQAEKSRQKISADSLASEMAAGNEGDAFSIPPSWEWVSTMTPVLMVSDQGKKIQTKDILVSGKYPVVDQGKVFIRGYCDDAEKVIHVGEPIVLFGDHTRETKYIDFDFVVGADGVKLLQPICVNPRYYFLALQWLPLESRGYARHFRLLRAARIPLPPLDEQKRIVAKVHELMAFCDRLEAQQQERETQHATLAHASLARFADAPTPANLDLLFHKSYTISPADLRNSILTLAVQGKLVPQNPIDGSVADLLKRELESKKLLVAQGKMREEKFLEPIMQGEEPTQIPRGWAWCKIDRLIFSLRDDIRTGPFGSTLHKHDHRKVGVPVWGIESIGKGGCFTGRNKIFVDEAKAHELNSFSVKGGDIIISRSGTVGELCKLPDAIQAGLISTNLMKISLNHRVITPDYFCLLFRGAISINAQLSELCFGSTRLFLTQKILTRLLFPVPPLAEQRRIVAKVDELMALVDALETQLATAHSTGSTLMKAAVSELTAVAWPISIPQRPPSAP